MTEPDNSFAVVQELAAKLARAEAALAAANASRQSLQDERDGLKRALETLNAALDWMWNDPNRVVAGRIAVIHEHEITRAQAECKRAILDNSPRSMGEEVERG